MSVEAPPSPATPATEIPRAYSRRETAGWMLLAGGSQGVKPNAVATIPCGLLSRNLRFKQFAAVDVASSVGGIVAGVVFAMLTHNYWALVIMQAAAGGST